MSRFSDLIIKGSYCSVEFSLLLFPLTGDAVVNLLESAALGLEGEACLEFRYLSPVPEEVSQLRALSNSSTGLREIWTSPEVPSNSWRQVFVQLILTEPGTKVE